MEDKYYKVQLPEKEVFLVPTAHISKNSVRDVEDTINEINPDSICVELDEQRYEKLKNPDAYINQDISKIIKEKKVNFLLANLILASFQRRMAKKLETESGNEMLKAIEMAKEKNCNLVLADRNIGTTFSRIWSKLGLIEKTKLLTNIIFSLFDNNEITEDDIANLKKENVIDSAINDVSKQFPVVKEVLVDERDKYLAYKIKNAKGNKVVAVIGAAHMKGIIENFKKEYDIDEINKKIPKSLISKIVPWIIPTIIVFAIVALFLSNINTGLNQIKRWVLITGCFSAIGTLIARGHILSALVAFIVAPITTIHPLLAAGWFSGLTEAKIRKPKVYDFENLANDTSNFKGFFKNNVTRILLVVVFTNIFASFATIISSIDLFKNFFNNF